MSDTIEDLRLEVERLRNQVKVAQIVVARGVELMPLKKLGQWSGVRSFQEQETEDYKPFLWNYCADGQPSEKGFYQVARFEPAICGYSLEVFVSQAYWLYGDDDGEWWSTSGKVESAVIYAWREMPGPPEFRKSDRERVVKKFHYEPHLVGLPMENE